MTGPPTAEAIRLLQNAEPLPEAMRAHLLTGNFKDHRECPPAPDWLLLYCTTETELVLVRTGSHSELF